jgi:hypothetical protein
LRCHGRAIGAATSRGYSDYFRQTICLFFEIDDATVICGNQNEPQKEIRAYKQDKMRSDLTSL